MDSMITSLITRFEESNAIQWYSILECEDVILHPRLKKKEKREDFIRNVKSLENFYEIDNLET